MSCYNNYEVVEDSYIILLYDDNQKTITQQCMFIYTTRILLCRVIKIQEFIRSYICNNCR